MCPYYLRAPPGSRQTDNVEVCLLSGVPFYPHPLSLTTVLPRVGVDIASIAELAEGQFSLVKKTVNVHRDMGKPVAASKKAIGVQDAVGGLEMDVDHVTAFSTYMVDLRFMEIM